VLTKSILRLFYVYVDSTLTLVSYEACLDFCLDVVVSFSLRPCQGLKTYEGTYVEARRILFMAQNPCGHLGAKASNQEVVHVTVGNHQERLDPPVFSLRWCRKEARPLFGPMQIARYETEAPLSPSMNPRDQKDQEEIRPFFPPCLLIRARLTNNHNYDLLTPSRGVR
jgi:hypothetical protein